jgi:Sec-independent protein translocase protein TatA
VSLSDSLFAFLSPSPGEMLLVMLVALLLYGGDLPKVARSWGKSLAEFKRGFSGIQNELNQVFQDEPRRISYHDPVYSHNAGTADSHDAGMLEGELADVTSSDEAVDEFSSKRLRLAKLRARRNQLNPVS